MPLTVVQTHSDCVYFVVLLATEELDCQAADEGGHWSYHPGEPLLRPEETSRPSVCTPIIIMTVPYQFVILEVILNIYTKTQIISKVSQDLCFAAAMLYS